MASTDRPENYEEEAAEVIETLRQLTGNIEPSPQLLAAVLAQGGQLLSPWRLFWRHWQQRIGAGLHRIETSPLWVLAPICLVLMMISSWQIRSQRSIQAALNEQRILLKTQQATLEG